MDSAVVPAARPTFWIGIVVRVTPWLIFLLLFSILAMLFLNWDSLESRMRIQTTNNAYVYFDNVVIEAKVSGYVKKVDFSDFQDVPADHILVALIDDDFVLAVQQAEAQQRYAQATLDNLDLEVAVQQASVEQAMAARDFSAANLEYMEREFLRTATLFKENAVSESDADTAETNFKTAKADVEECQAALLSAEQQLKLLEQDRPARQANLDAAKAATGLAWLNLSYTKMKANVASTTGACLIQEGELVQVGTVIATLTPHQVPYVIANFKETQLTHIQIGQVVTMEMDTFPGHKFRGWVTSISPATGATYSLVPVDRSAGNFTKVVQRIPVRIDLDPNQSMLEKLRSGMSVTASVDTHTGTEVP